MPVFENNGENEFPKGKGAPGGKGFYYFLSDISDKTPPIGPFPSEAEAERVGKYWESQHPVE